MANLTITKVTDGYFDFNDDANNTYGGNNISYWYDATNIYFKVNGQVYTYTFEEVSYDDGSETIGFASTIEVITALKTSGFTGNFNSGGATPQSKIYKAYLTQVGTDAPTATIIKNTIGNITWSYNDLGIYSANLTSAFTINKTSVILPNQVKFAGDGETSQMWWCVDDSSVDSIVIQSNGASYDEVMYKQVIIIEVEN